MPARDRIGVHDLTTLERQGTIRLAPDPGSSTEAHHLNDVVFHNGELLVR